MALRAGSSYRVYVIPAVAVTLLVLIFIIIRLERDSARYLRLGDQAVQRGQRAEALFYWKMSMMMYVPFSPTSRAAAERLRAAAEASLKEGDPDGAARAFGYLRSGLLGIRHIRQPMPELLAAAERRLAMLRPTVPYDAADRRIRAGGTAIAGTILLCAGFIAWPISFYRMLRGWRECGRVFSLPRVVPMTLSLLMIAAGALLA